MLSRIEVKCINTSVTRLKSFQSAFLGGKKSAIARNVFNGTISRMASIWYFRSLRGFILGLQIVVIEILPIFNRGIYIAFK